MREIEFQKYQQHGRAYHWDQCSNHVTRMNAFLKARYWIVLECIELLQPNPETKVLDVGCGDGALAGQIQQRFKCEITGIDPVDQALALARSKFAEHGYKGEFRKVSHYSYGFPDGAFDIVVCADVIEHVRQPTEMLNEMKRVLKSGGHVIIGTPIKFTETPLDRMHVQEWYVNEFVSLCSGVFGTPKKIILSHPLFWYEFYNVNLRHIRAAAKYTINLLAKWGINVFLNRDHKAWRCYTMQTLVLEKE